MKSNLSPGVNMYQYNVKGHDTFTAKIYFILYIL